MLGIKQPPVCKTPDLCIIACPYNRILTELGERSCELPLPLSDGEDNAIEVVAGFPAIEEPPTH
jgi:hypothetical protein